MAANLVTVEDLQDFKKDLIQEIKSLLAERQNLNNKKWLKSSELRKLLPLSAGTLQNLRVNGTLPFTKIGGVIFYSHEDVQKMIDSHQGYSPSPELK